MYESPIKLIESQMRTEMEDCIFRAIKEVGVDVNKKELIKALQYDREQYEKGYADAVREFAKRLKEKAQVKQITPSGNYFYDIDDYLIAKLVKEMVGEE